jgi:hypothetical protein
MATSVSVLTANDMTALMVAVTKAVLLDAVVERDAFQLGSAALPELRRRERQLLG